MHVVKGRSKRDALIENEDFNTLNNERLKEFITVLHKAYMFIVSE